MQTVLRHTARKHTMERRSRQSSPARSPFGFAALGLGRVAPPALQRVRALSTICDSSSTRVAVGGRFAAGLWGRDLDLTRSALSEPVELLATRRAGVTALDRLHEDVLIETTAITDTSLWWEAQLATDWDEFTGATECLETVRALRRHAITALVQTVDVHIEDDGPYRVRLLRPVGLALAAIARFAEAPTALGMRDAAWASAMELIVDLLERQRDSMFSDVWAMRQSYMSRESELTRFLGREQAVEVIIEFLDHGQYDDAVELLRDRCDAHGPMPFHTSRLGPALTWCEQAALALAPE